MSGAVVGHHQSRPRAAVRIVGFHCGQGETVTPAPDNFTEFEIALEQTPAPVVELNDCEQIAAVLEDAGILALPEIVHQLDALIDNRAQRRAGEALRSILRSISGTPAGRALERVILGDDGRSLADDAAEVGCTKQNMHHHVDSIGRKLRHLTPATLIET